VSKVPHQPSFVPSQAGVFSDWIPFLAKPTLSALKHQHDQRNNNINNSWNNRCGL